MNAEVDQHVLLLLALVRDIERYGHGTAHDR